MGDVGDLGDRKPIFSFGVIADVQYADKDSPGPDAWGHTKRFREATGKLEKAVAAFNQRKENLFCVLTLGDIIEGNVTPEETNKDFDEVLIRLAKIELPTYHLLGNHCLKLSRDVVMKGLGMTDRYYKINIHPGWSLVVLDSMDLSVEWPVDSEKYKEALAFLEDHPLVSDGSSQMVDWSGGIAAEQKGWLARILQDAERDGTRLIVASHIPVLRGSVPNALLMWNYDEVAAMLLGCPSVVLYLCGHYHKGGYARDGNKHFVIVQSIIEAPTGSEAHGFVHVYDDQIIIEGYGYVESRVLPIDGSRVLQDV